MGRGECVLALPSRGVFNKRSKEKFPQVASGFPGGIYLLQKSSSTGLSFRD